MSDIYRKPTNPDEAKAPRPKSRGDAVKTLQPKYVDPTPRCEICDWPLHATIQDGCTAGNCSYRPQHGTEEYARIQARREEVTRRVKTE